MAVSLDEPRSGDAPPTGAPTAEPLRRLATFPDVSPRLAPSPAAPGVATPAPVAAPNTRVFAVSTLIVIVLVVLAWVDWPTSGGAYDTPTPEEKFRSGEGGSSKGPLIEPADTGLSRGSASTESSPGKADVAQAPRTARPATWASRPGRVLLNYILESTEGKRDGQSRSGVY